MRKTLLLMFVLLSCMAGSLSAKNANEDVHALLFVEGGYSHTFGDLNSTASQYFSSFQRQLRNGYTAQATAMGCFSENFSAGVVAWKKGFSASNDDPLHEATETQDIKYIGPAIGGHEYFGPGLLFVCLSLGYTHFSDKYVIHDVRLDEREEDRFATGALGYLFEFKYMFCLGKYVMVGPGMGYFGFQGKNSDGQYWTDFLENDGFRVDGFNITACVGLKF